MTHSGSWQLICEQHVIFKCIHSWEYFYSLLIKAVLYCVIQLPIPRVAMVSINSLRYSREEVPRLSNQEVLFWMFLINGKRPQVTREPSPLEFNPALFIIQHKVTTGIYNQGQVLLHSPKSNATSVDVGLPHALHPRCSSTCSNTCRYTWEHRDRGTLSFWSWTLYQG